jgi:hypothetical protein
LSDTGDGSHVSHLRVFMHNAPPIVPVACAAKTAVPCIDIGINKQPTWVKDPGVVGSTAVVGLFELSMVAHLPSILLP